MKKILWAALLILPWLAAGCGDSHSNLGPDPSFETAYSLATQGKFDETADFFSDSILTYMKLHPDMTMQALWNDRLNGGSVKGIKIIEHTLTDTSCDYKMMLFTNEGMADGEDTMVFEKGAWKFNTMKRIR